MKLQVKNLSKRFMTSRSKNSEYVTAIENIDLTINDGEFVCIVGPSGCGKSTLLNILAGLDKPTEGQIILNGHEVDGTDVRLLARREIGCGEHPVLEIVDAERDRFLKTHRA